MSKTKENIFLREHNKNEKLDAIYWELKKKRIQKKGCDYIDEYWALNQNIVNNNMMLIQKTLHLGADDRLDSDIEYDKQVSLENKELMELEKRVASI